MAANLELERVNEWGSLRGFANLFQKENRAWWGTHRWWINALLWTALLCGLTAIILFMPNEDPMATEAEIAKAGGLIAYTLLMGLSAFFEFGAMALAIGTVIQSQDLILSEKQSGVTEWLLSKPVRRSAYILAKFAANAAAVLPLLVGLPSVVAYSMLSLRMGAFFPLAPFLSGVAVIALHTLFYLSLTLMLGTLFNNRGPVLGIALASALGGGLLGGFFKPLLYVTPWMLAKVASLAASAQPIPVEMGLAPLAATVVWCLVFILVALWKFANTEF